MQCAAALFLVYGLAVFAQDLSPSERAFREGEKAFSERRLDDAARAYQELAHLNSRTAEVHAKLGLIYYMQGKFSQAVPAFREAMRLKPGLPNVDVMLAVSLTELGQFAEALPALERRFHHPPNEAATRPVADDASDRLVGLELQRAYTGLHRLDDAARVSLDLARLHPNDPEILYEAGRIHGELAYERMRRLSQAAPDSVWAHEAAAEAAEALGSYELAIIEYRKVLALDASRPGLHFRLGRALLARDNGSGSRVSAAGEFERELTIDPSNAAAAYELADIHRKNGDYEQARKYFEAAVQNAPQMKQARIGLGRVLLERNDPQAALAHLRQAEQLDPANEATHFLLARAYQALGNSGEARKALTEFRRLRAEKRKLQFPGMFRENTLTEQEIE